MSQTHWELPCVEQRTPHSDRILFTKIGIIRFQLIQLFILPPLCPKSGDNYPSSPLLLLSEPCNPSYRPNADGEKIARGPISEGRSAPQTPLSSLRGCGPLTIPAAACIRRADGRSRRVAALTVCQGGNFIESRCKPSGLRF